MLILKEPVKLKSLSPIIRRTDGFYERMHANYQVLWAKYGPEDLFHLLSLPPQVYVNEGGMTTFVTQNHNQMNQEVRLLLVHNLINRLMTAEPSRLTYQDMVYVQTMLQRLGVKNVSEFMEQLYETREDTQNIRKLTGLYEKNMTVLKEAVQTAGADGNIRERKKADRMPGERKDQAKENKRPYIYWLHQEIFRHLRTETVYHTAVAFQKDAVYHYDQIKEQEAKMAGQARTLAVLRLHRLHQEVLTEETPLVSHRMNLYEEGTGGEPGGKDRILQELAGAVLLNLTDDLYQLRAEEISENRSSWYRIQGDLREIIQNTLDRFQAYHLSGISEIQQEIRHTLQRSVNEFREQEILRLREILETEEGQEEEAADVSVLAIREELERKREEERAVSRELMELIREQEILRQDDSRSGGGNLSERQQILEWNDRGGSETEMHKFAVERMHRMIGAEERRALEELNQTNQSLQRQNLPDQSENQPFSNAEEKEQVHALREEVRRLNEENRRKMKETVEESRQKMEEAVEENRNSSVQIDRERTRKETLLLLEHPELAGRYFQEEEPPEREEAEIIARLLERMEEHTRLTEEIRRLEHLIEPLEGSTKRLTEAMSAKEGQTDILHRQAAVDYEQIWTELTAFLTYLDAEKDSEERADVSQIQKVLEGHKRQKTSAGDRKVVAKRLLVLRDTLTELERMMHTEMQTGQTEMQRMQPGMAEMQRMQSGMAEMQNRQPETAETQSRQTGIMETQAVWFEKRKTAKPAETEHAEHTEHTEQRTEIQRSEIRRNYAETLHQICQILDGYQIREDGSSTEQTVRQASSQKKNLLELLRSSENLLLSEPAGQREPVHVLDMQRELLHGQEKMIDRINVSEAEKEVVRVSEKIRQRRVQAVREYLDTIEKYQITEARFEEAHQTMEESRLILYRTAVRPPRQGQVHQLLKEAGHRAVRREQDTLQQKVQLYHKRQEIFGGEMVMEEIRNLSGVRQNVNTVHTDSQTRIQNEPVKQQKHQIHVQTENAVKKSAGDISEMVQRGVQRQIDNISNQVYRRLERRLSDDRKRRGY